MNINPKARQYLEEGWQKYNNGDYKGAIECFDKAIKLDSGFAEAYCERGTAKAALEHYDEAIADYDKAIKLNPRFAWAYFWRGLAKLDLHRYEEAIIDFDEAIKLDSVFTEAHKERGLAKASLKQYEEAIIDFDEAIKLDPNFVDAYNERGLAKASLKQYEEAITDFDKTIKLGSSFEWAYFWRGLAKLDLHHYEEAIVDFDESVKINPQFILAYNERSTTKEKLKQYKEASADQKIIIKLDPEHTEAKERILFLSYMEGDLVPPYFYIPFFNKKYRYLPKLYVLFGSVYFVLFLAVCYCYYSIDKTILDIIPIGSLFVLIGFFFVAFEIEHKNNEDGDESKTKPTFNILLKSFIAGVSLFTVAHILNIFIDMNFDNNTIVLIKNIFENILGLCFIILLYILINRMRTLFLKISEQYKDRKSFIK